MFIYRQNSKYIDPLNIIFLCGSKYSFSNPNEKRNVLKRHIESSIPGCRALILEEHFQFASTTKSYLSYDDIFLYSLAQIEELASLFANNIVIIHETVSTAAELGMFAANPELTKKICLLSPDDVSIEEKKVSTFIEKAFLVSSSPETMIGKHIVYYPDVHVHRESCNKSEYWTTFHNNSIGQELSKSLLSFLHKEEHESEICFRSPPYGSSNSGSNTIDYRVNKDNTVLSIALRAETLKILLLALFLNNNFQTNLCVEKPIKDHVTDIEQSFYKLIHDSVSDLSNFDISNYEVKISIKNANCSVRQAIGYFLYMLQGIGLIKMEQTHSKFPQIRKVLPTADLESLRKSFPELIIERPQTAFGRLMT